MFRQVLFLGSALLLAVYACKKDANTTFTCTGITPTYTTDIKPIYVASCATGGCHDASERAAGIDLSSYTATKGANDDKIIGSIEHTSGYETMPRGASKLSDDKIQKIYCWIQNGKPE